MHVNFFLWERMCNETKVTEEYCWAITQVAGPSCCDQSGSGVLEFRFQLGYHVHMITRTLTSDLRKFNLCQSPPEHNCCISRGVPVELPRFLDCPSACN